MNDLPLATEFPAARREDWLALVEKVLKGESFDRLRAKTRDGIAIEPLYDRAAKAAPLAGRAPGAPWQIAQRVDHPDPAAANAEALHELENGAGALSLVFAGSIGAYGYGLDGSAAAIDRALAGVHLDAGIALELDLSPQTKDAGAHLAALVKKRGITPGKTDIRFGFDPSARWRRAEAVHSHGKSSLRSFITPSTQSQAKASTDLLPSPTDGSCITPAGPKHRSSPSCSRPRSPMSRALETSGVPFQDSRHMIFFRLSADADQFLTIAKFRALRKLWARVEEASSLAPKPIFISAETAWRMLTKRDPYVNMLRATIAVAAAGFGGANAISALPFTSAVGLPDRFARRIARNTQLILLEESHLARVTDPAAGAGAVEEITSRLCDTAWRLFQEIEREGGAPAALEQGSIQKRVAARARPNERMQSPTAVNPSPVRRFFPTRTNCRCRY